MRYAGGIGRGRRHRAGLLGAAAIVGALISATPAYAGVCQVPAYLARGLTDLSESERIVIAADLNDAQFAKLKAAPAGDRNYYQPIASSPVLADLQRSAEQALAAGGLAQFRSFVGTNTLDDAGLAKFALCEGGNIRGLHINGRRAGENRVKIILTHASPIGVGPLPTTVVSASNIANVDELKAFVAGTIGSREVLDSVPFTLTIADPKAPAQLKMAFGDENPVTLDIPGQPLAPAPPLRVTASAAPARLAATQPARRRKVETRRAGTVFRDCTDVCPELVVLPAGRFTMGSSPAEDAVPRPAQQRDAGKPLHEVTIGKGEAIGKYAVTVAEFRAFVDATGYKAAEKCYVLRQNGDKWVYDEQPGFSWRNPGYEQTDRHAVTCVSWNDAKAYSDWLTKRTGHLYRLPSESVREYATRAGTTTAYFWGNAEEDACAYANVTDLTKADVYKTEPQHRFECRDGYVTTSPVGMFKPNQFGLYDMIGNVWEWTEDCWNPSYEGAPADGSPWLTGECGQRAERGGSSANTKMASRASVRFGGLVDYRGDTFGFRVARQR